MRSSTKKAYVIDASVAVKWFVEEEGSLIAREYLQLIKENPAIFFVPELFFIEILSVLSKCTNESKELINYVNLLEQLGITRIAHSHELLKEAAVLCNEFKLSAYDASYASLAKLISGVWITADKKAHLKIAKLKISESIL